MTIPLPIIQELKAAFTTRKDKKPTEFFIQLSKPGYRWEINQKRRGIYPSTEVFCHILALLSSSTSGEWDILIRIAPYGDGIWFSRDRFLTKTGENQNEQK